MATENRPGEDVSPIKNGEFNCHVSSPEGTWNYLAVEFSTPVLLCIFSPATTVVVDLPALSALSSEERIQGRWGQVTQQSRRVEDVDDGPIWWWSRIHREGESVDSWYSQEWIWTSNRKDNWLLWWIQTMFRPAFFGDGVPSLGGWKMKHFLLEHWGLFSGAMSS